VTKIQDIDYSILPEAFTPMYRIHKYWGRKPGNIFREYIKNYTSENDIFLDPFCGSGIAVAEALKLNRKVIGIDLNPMATFITRQMVIPIDLLRFEHTFEKIVNNVSQKFSESYSTQCRKCGSFSKVIHYKWGREKLARGISIEEAKKETGEIPRELQSLTYECVKCRRLISDKPLNHDITQANISYGPPPNYLINKKLIKTLHSEAEYYFDLFTPRNLFLLSILYDEILKIADIKIQDIMKLVFSSCLEQSSRLLMYTKIGKQQDVRSKSWIAPKFHIQRSYLEKNPLINFKNSFQKILLSKKESNRLLLNCNFVKTFDDLVAGKGNVLIVNDSVDYLDKLPKDSIDYVIADPPFVKDIRYLELSQLWHIWLGFDVNYDKEIKYDEREHRAYTIKLTEAFKKVHRVLKKGSQMTVTYQTDDIKLWDTMVRSPLDAKFILTKILPQGVKYSTGAKYRSLMKKGEHKLLLGYYYLTFNKKNNSLNNKSFKNDSGNKIIKQVISLIEKRQEATPLIFILLSLYEKMTLTDIRKYSIINILSILESSNQVEKYFETHKNPLWQKWTIKKAKFNVEKSLETLVKNDLEEILLYENQVSPTDFIQFIMNKFKGDYIVSSQRVYRLLNEISKIDKGNRILVGEKSVVAERKREEVIKNLKKLGRQYSFEAKAQENNVLFWNKYGKPRIMFYITLTGILPSPEIEAKSKDLKNQFPGFQRIIVRPQSLDKIFEDMTEHWDYIWLEDLEKLLFDKEIIHRFIKKIQRQTISRKRVVKATVIKNERYEVDGETRYFKLVLDEPYIQNNAQPGQFINILCPSKNLKDEKHIFDSEKTYNTYLRKNGSPYSGKPLLRRPISIHRIYYKDFDPKSLKKERRIPEDLSKILRSGRRDRFDVFIKVVGKGTKALSNIEEGEKLDMIGPLGKPIEVDKKLKKALLVAGGIGIAPLYALAEELRWTGRNVVLFLGTYDEKDLKILGYDFHTDQAYAMQTVDAKKLIKEFKNMGIKVVLCTMRGNIPGVKQGLVTEEFKKFLSDNRNSLKNTCVFSCGPKAMLKSVVNIVKKFKLPHKVLLEERMGCGLGACLSCVCPTKDKPFEYKRICTEGPTFDAEEIAWNQYL
jgi:NAD(P)H-flavin reductase/16S rRNA G966 N2-methylase RsmD